MNANTQSLLRDISQNIDALVSSKLDRVGTKSVEYIEEVESLKKDAQNRFQSFYGRKKLIDYLVITNLAITPLILVFVVYWTFFSK